MNIYISIELSIVANKGKAQYIPFAGLTFCGSMKALVCTIMKVAKSIGTYGNVLKSYLKDIILLWK